MKMRKYVLLFLLLALPLHAEVNCVSGLISVYDYRGIPLSSQFAQTYKAVATATNITQPGKQTIIRTPDIVCTATAASSVSSAAVSSVRFSSSSSSRASTAAGQVLYQNDFESGTLPTSGEAYFWANQGATIGISSDRRQYAPLKKPAIRN